MIIKTIISAKIPITTTYKIFIPFRKNYFNKFHYVSKSFLIYIKNSFINTYNNTIIINTKHFFQINFKKNKL